MSSSRRSLRHTSPSPKIRASPCISTAVAARSSAAARIPAEKWPRGREHHVDGGEVPSSRADDSLRLFA
eukprot:6572311-Prymnesium_polylepis.1